MVNSALNHNQPLVSVNIPTYNSAATLALTLESVAKQTFKNLEIIVIDSNSVDHSREIAQKYDARVVLYDGKLLGARYIGVKESQGDYILLLDSDQILEETAIERACYLVKENEYDMLALEEHSYLPSTWVQRQLQGQRKASHASIKGLDPLQGGGLLARFYRKDILEKAFECVPKELLPIVGAHDHAIIYLEAYYLTQSVTILPNAVWHQEPQTLSKLAKKFFNWGKSTKPLVKSGYYQNIVQNATSLRNRSKYTTRPQNLIINLVKGLSYRLGLYL
jgi:glycosyltransferase involved in cell wall biosynthesis